MLKHSLGEQSGFVWSFPTHRSSMEINTTNALKRYSATLQSKTGHCTWQRSRMIWIMRCQIGHSELCFTKSNRLQKMVSNLLFGSQKTVSDQSPAEGFESPLSAIGSQQGSAVAPVERLEIDLSARHHPGFHGFPMLSPDWEPSNSQVLWPSKPDSPSILTLHLWWCFSFPSFPALPESSDQPWLGQNLTLENCRVFLSVPTLA